jgi:predicted RNA binding protein YcfA (HicA-like mRNA interferase family)
MTKVPQFTYKDLIKKLRKAGFQFDRQAKGSHEIWYNPVSKRRTVVPNHPGTISKSTLSAIIKQTGYNPDDFLNI